jgi:transketolase
MNTLKDTATQIRRDIVRMVHAVQSGHPGGSLGCAEYFTALFFDIMDHNPQFNMDGKNEDLFFLSNGHISPVLYSALAHAGYFDKSELSTFRKLNTRLQGHPTTHEHLPGVRIASGSLGQGMSVALGAAYTKKLHGDTKTIYSLHGDGELEEGQIWEAVLFAAHHKMDNYIATIDWNGQQIDGTTDQVMGLGNLKEKFEVFGWQTIDLPNGNDMDEVIAALHLAKTFLGKGKPIVILMKTIMGKGVSFMEGKHEWHGTAPSDAQLAQALTELPETLGDY